MTQHELETTKTQAFHQNLLLNFVHTKSKFLNFGKGFVIMQRLNDNFFCKLSVSHEYITLSVSRRSYVRKLIQENTVYRLSYHKLTKTYAVPVDCYLPYEVCKLLKQVLVDLRKFDFIPTKLQGFASGDPITIKPKIAKMEMISRVVPSRWWKLISIASQLMFVVFPLIWSSATTAQAIYDSREAKRQVT